MALCMAKLNSAHITPLVIALCRMLKKETIERDNKLKIEETMTKIYNTNFAQGDTEKSSGDAPDPQNDKKTEPQKPIEPGYKQI